MPGISIDGFGYTLEELTDYFSSEYGKGAYHSEALFRHLYSRGDTIISGIEEFRPSPDLAEKVEHDFRIQLPDIAETSDNSGTLKFTLAFNDGALTESVVIQMAEWDTLCLSSQVGCSRGCVFCETARMGLLRNLNVEEIMTQWAVSKFQLHKNPRNIVFMGMGEPFDNFESVIRAVDILSDQRGAAIPKRRISISTSGHVDGIRCLTEMESRFPERAYRTMHLAVSLNAPNDRIRSELMPINRIWPMADLKSALADAPQSGIKDALYFEYVLIPGVNDENKHAEQLIEWMDGLTAKVNLIPYHPTGSTIWSEPDEASLNRFHTAIRSSGRECRTRRSRGKGIDAACGMLANKGRINSSSL